MATALDLAGEVEHLHDLFRQQQHRMRVYLWIFGILMICTLAVLIYVAAAASGAKNQSFQNHNLGVDNRKILCFIAVQSAHGAPLPKGCIPGG